MAAKTAPTQRPLPRLYLATPPLGDGTGFNDRLSEALSAADVAAVLLRLVPADDRSLIKRIKALKPQRIVGAGGLQSRDDAMTAGEAGADYVLFGEPDPTGHRPRLEAIADR